MCTFNEANNIQLSSCSVTRICSDDIHITTKGAVVAHWLTL